MAREIFWNLLDKKYVLDMFCTWWRVDGFKMFQGLSLSFCSEEYVGIAGFGASQIIEGLHLDCHSPISTLWGT